MSLPFDPFAELNQIQRTECRNGLAYTELGKTAADVLDRIVKKHFVDNDGKSYWHDGSPSTPLGEVDLSFWTDVAARAAQVIDLPESEQGTLEISAKGLAKTLHTQYCVSTDIVPNWEDLTSNEKIGWEAVGRHLANLIDSDGQTPNFPELEERIVGWARERISAPQLVLS
jgi:hypothetical protein